MLAWSLLCWGSATTLWTLEPSSFINEKADILTATKINYHRFSLVRMTETKQKRGPHHKRVPVHGNPGDRAVVKTCIKFFCCSWISFTLATWMQAVMQSKIFSCGTWTCSMWSSSAKKDMLILLTVQKLNIRYKEMSSKNSSQKKQDYNELSLDYSMEYSWLWNMQRHGDAYFLVEPLRVFAQWG